MKRTIASVLGLVMFIAVFALPVFSHEDEKQPHMAAALNALRQAESELKAAKADKGGHREAAIKATQEAIKQVEAGMKYADKR